MKLANINIKSIFAGFVMVWVASVGTGFLIGILLRLLSLDGTIKTLLTPPGSLWCGFILGVWGSIIGGYTTGVIAKKSVILNALLAGILTVAADMIHQWEGPMLAEIKKEAVVIPSVILGGWLALKIKLSNQRTHSITGSAGSE
jgi:hypothetical protein